MSIRNKASTFLIVLLAAVMIAQTSVMALSSETAFSDVPADAWYAKHVENCAMLEIVKGYSDGTFKPDKELTRGEYMCMLAKAGDDRFIQLSGNTQAYDPKPKSGEHWAAPYYRILNQYKVFAGMNITSTAQSLNTLVTRYEMAAMTINFLVNVEWENNVKTVSPEKVISDYASIPSGYREDVVQAYGKGIITGYGDGSFRGTNILSRAQACVVIENILWVGDRKLASFVDTTVQTAAAKPSGYVAAAAQWQKNGWIDGYGNASAQLKTILFGSSSVSCFTSSSQAANYMKTVTVPVWKLNNSGTKYASKTSITVNKAVADDIVAIFTQIYNDPEKFPIESIGGARYTDTMRHSWGCAIDINPYVNAECRAYYNADGSINKVVQTCGYGWWPVGTDKTAFAGSMSAPSAYSIGKGSSVVKAFKAYGWGWVGNGYSVRNSSQKFDYMHFSVMSNGG